MATKYLNKSCHVDFLPARVKDHDSDSFAKEITKPS